MAALCRPFFLLKMEHIDSKYNIIKSVPYVVVPKGVDAMSNSKETYYQKASETYQNRDKNVPVKIKENMSGLTKYLVDRGALNNCDGTLKLTEEYMANYTEEEKLLSLGYLMSHGGYCDCEVLLNVSTRWL